MAVSKNMTVWSSTIALFTKSDRTSQSHPLKTDRPFPMLKLAHYNTTPKFGK